MQSTLLGLLSGAALCTLAPIFVEVPRPMAIASRLCGIGLGLSLAGVAKAYEGQEKIDAAEQETILHILREQMARERAVNAGIVRESSLMEFRHWVETNLLPDDQITALAKFGTKPSWMMAQQAQAVVTQAVEVPQTVAIAAPMPTNAVYQSPPQVQQQAYQVLEVEDLALTYVKMTQSGGTIRNVLMPAEPGVGKSTFICAVIHRLNEVHKGNVDLKVFAGKLPDPEEDPGYCGLENSDNDYLFSGDYENTRAVHKRLKRITGLVKVPAQPWPTILIQDELNNTLDAAEMGDKEAFKDITALNDLRLTQGRSRRIVDFITAHSHLVKDIRYNTSKQHAFDLIIPGRYPNAMNSITAAFSDSKLIKDPETRDRLFVEFKDFLDSPTEGVIALTNLGGEWRLVQIPDYRPYCVPIQRGILNQSSEELADEFEQDVWEDEPQDNQRLYEQLIAEVKQSGAFDMPKDQTIATIAKIAEAFFARHKRPLDQDKAHLLAQYLWDLKANGEMSS